jgi:hypothetical protein
VRREDLIDDDGYGDHYKIMDCEDELLRELSYEDDFTLNLIKKYYLSQKTVISECGQSDDIIDLLIECWGYVIVKKQINTLKYEVRKISECIKKEQCYLNK